MTEIPQPVVDQTVLAQWYGYVKELQRLKAAEMLLRQRIFRLYFPDPREGTNTAVLPDTYQLKGTHVINRKVIEESMQALCYRAPNPDGTFQPSKLEQAGVRVDMLIKWKPELAISAYRELTEEQRHLVDQMLLIDQGSPSLKIEPPKKPRGGAAKPAPDDIKVE